MQGIKGGSRLSLIQEYRKGKGMEEMISRGE